jgi:hypothetical protein
MMKSEVLLGILMFYGCHTVLVAEICRVLEDGNYTAIEGLLLTDSNLIKLEGTFFPTNSHSSVVVDVNYHFNITEKEHQFNGDLKLTTNDLRTPDNHTFKFRWMASPVNLLIRPSLLKRLSLMTYQENVAVLTLELEVKCESDFVKEAIDSDCRNVSQLLYQLNNMTSNVSRLYCSFPENLGGYWVSMHIILHFVCSDCMIH